MCIAILKTAKGSITAEQFLNCWENNPDGGGMMYAVDGKLHIYRELTDVKKFYQDFCKVESKFGCDIVLHFRWCTHGYVSKSNCHPVRINKNLGYVHNGIIKVPMPDKCAHSDTVEFKNRILSKLPDGFLDNPAIIDLIEEYIGNSKLIFMNNEGRNWIIKEQDGTWAQECWFSNDAYKTRRAVVQRYDWKGYFRDTYGKGNVDGYWDEDEDAENYVRVCTLCKTVRKCADMCYYGDKVGWICNKCEKEQTEPAKIELAKYRTAKKQLLLPAITTDDLWKHQCECHNCKEMFPKEQAMFTEKNEPICPKCLDSGEYKVVED